MGNFSIAVCHHYHFTSLPFYQTYHYFLCYLSYLISYCRLMTLAAPSKMSTVLWWTVVVSGEVYGNADADKWRWRYFCFWFLKCFWFWFWFWLWFCLCCAANLSENLETTLQNRKFIWRLYSQLKSWWFWHNQSSQQLNKPGDQRLIRHLEYSYALLSDKSVLIIDQMW